MLSSLFLTALISSLALAQKNAPVITNEVSGAAYTANLPSSGHVQGTMTGFSNATAGVNFDVNFYAFPQDQGPFSSSLLTKDAIVVLIHGDSLPHPRVRSPS